MNIGIVIQARLGSTRLPGKILKPFHDSKTLIDIILDRLHQLERMKVVVATTVNPADDPLVRHLEQRDELVYRGSENDVLSRFIGAAETYRLDGLIRICSDNPFIDLEGLKTLEDKALKSEADYIGFRINGMPSIKTHFGFWGEYATLDALRHVYSTTDDPQAHEHVTIHLYTHPDTYRCEWVDCPAFIQGRDDIRLTVDTQEDFDNAQKVFGEALLHNPKPTLEEIIGIVDGDEKLRQSMKRIIAQNQK